MSYDDISFSGQFTFLKYVNEYYLIYSITVFTFLSLFSLVWILKKYTYFEKLKITAAGIPTFPYGNFRDVIKQENSLHVFLWKHYNRFKRKGCKFGGLFLFTKPTILLVDSRIASCNNDSSFVSLFPYQSKLKQNDANKILESTVLSRFVEKSVYSLKGTLPEKLLKNEVTSVLKDYLLESICLAFGLNSFEMVEEINGLLKARHNASYKYYLSLYMPFLTYNQNKLTTNLKEILQEIMDDRKKNDLKENDLIQSFTEIYNESSYTMEDITNEVFNMFADTLTYSYSTLIMCLYELAENREIQEDVIGEVRRFNKTNKKITYENLEELVYLDAAVKETLRKYPPIATVISSYRGGMNIDGFDWGSALIFQSILGIHRDPRYYTKPEAFEPDRFTEKEGLIKDVFIPFGQGPRSQLYMTFISLQVKVILLSIFSCLEVKLKVGVTNGLKYNPELLYLSPAEDLKLDFIRL